MDALPSVSRWREWPTGENPFKGEPTMDNPTLFERAVAVAVGGFVAVAGGFVALLILAYYTL